MFEKDLVLCPSMLFSDFRSELASEDAFQVTPQ